MSLSSRANTQRCDGFTIEFARRPLGFTRGEDRPNDFGLLLDDLRFTLTTRARDAVTGVRPIADNPAVSHHSGYSPLDRLRFNLARQLIDEIFDADVS